MAAINFSGLASGLDTRAIVDAILSVERQPLERLESRRILFNQQKSAIDELKSKLDSFESSLRQLATGRAFRGRTTTVSDDTRLRATAGSNAETGIFEIRVDQLAQAAKVRSDGFASRDESLSTSGTITIQSGDNDLITIDVSASNGNDNLTAIRDEINGADAGVSASIIFDGTDYLLTVRADESGLANDLVVSDDTSLNLDTNVVSLAQDANVNVDGIAVTSSSNKISEAIDGVTFDLLEADAGTTITVEVTQDDEGVVEAVSGLVDSFNEVQDFFNTQFDRNSPGALYGDSTATRIQSQIQSLFTGGVDGIPLGAIRSLASLGVAFDGKSGKAELDESKLRELLETSFDEVGSLFESSGRATDPKIQYLAAGSDAVAGEYAIEITQAPEAATVVGEYRITSLHSDENLTITVGEETIQVQLLGGDRIDEVVDTLNQDFAAAGFGAVASDDAGRLRITTTDVGSDVELFAVADRFIGPGGRSSGIGRAGRSDTGEDLAGTIDGVAATANGRFLTAAEGSAAAGIQVKVLANADDIVASGGDFGTVSYSRGFVNAVVSRIDQLTRSGDGPLFTAKESVDVRLKSLDADVSRIEDRLAVRENQLLRSFAAAERAISALQGQQSLLGSL